MARQLTDKNQVQKVLACPLYLALLGCPVALREVPIKPWRDCDPGEHLHPDNYLVLTAALAEAFTAGCWSLDDEGHVLRASSLRETERQRLSPENAPVNTRLTAKQRIFLMHHRAFVFQPD